MILTYGAGGYTLIGGLGNFVLAGQIVNLYCPSSREKISTREVISNREPILNREVYLNRELV